MKIILITICTFILIGCQSNQPLVKPYILEGVHVTHGGNTVKDITTKCGRYDPYVENNKVKQFHVHGCVKLQTHSDGSKSAQIIAHTPTNAIERDIWKHEEKHIIHFARNLPQFHNKARGYVPNH